MSSSDEATPFDAPDVSLCSTVDLESPSAGSGAASTVGSSSIGASNTSNSPSSTGASNVSDAAATPEPEEVELLIFCINSLNDKCLLLRRQILA